MLPSAAQCHNNQPNRTKPANRVTAGGPTDCSRSSETRSSAVRRPIPSPSWWSRSANVSVAAVDRRATGIRHHAGIRRSGACWRWLPPRSISFPCARAIRCPAKFSTGRQAGSGTQASEHRHRPVAYKIVEWLSADDSAPDALLSVVNDPPLRHHVEQALTRAAEVLALASPQLVLERIEQLGAELAYVESLRDRLLRRVRNMSVEIERLTRIPRQRHAGGDARPGQTVVRYRLAANHRTVPGAGQPYRRYHHRVAQCGAAAAPGP